MNYKLFKTKHYLIMLGVCLVLFILGCIYDKDISQQLYANIHQEKAGIIISNIFLLITLFLAIVFAGSSIIIAYKTKANKVRIPFIIVAIGGIGFFIYSVFKEFYSNKHIIGTKVALIVGISVIVLTIVASIFAIRYCLKKYNNEKIFRFTLIYGAVILISLAIFVFFKYFWGRPRPWFVYAHENPSLYFSPVWELHPFAAFKSTIGKEFYKSFPSNHVNVTLLGLMGLLLLTKLDTRLDKDRTRAYMIYCMGFIGLCAAFTRILGGAHFLSDVSMGFAISITIIYLGFLVMNNLNKSKNLFEIKE